MTTTRPTGMTQQYDVDDIMKVVNEMPEDLCYHSQAIKHGVEITSACVYAHVTDKGIEPICMVGYIVHKLNPALLVQVVELGENKQGLDETCLTEEFTPSALRLLQEWQCVQDRNQMEPWSKIAHDLPLEAIG